MITVKTPDGGVAQFPDGTDPNVIKQALAKKFAPDKALAPNMLAAKRAGEGTLEVSPDAARKQAAFDQAHIGPLEDSMKTGRLDALGCGALQGLTFGGGEGREPQSGRAALPHAGAEIPARKPAGGPHRGPRRRPRD